MLSQRSEKSAKRNKLRYDKKVRGAVPVVGDRVLLKNVGLHGKHKIADKWQKEVYLIVGQKDLTLPVYQIQMESGKGDVRTVHRNLLLPLVLPLDPQVPQTRPPLEQKPPPNTHNQLKGHNLDSESSDADFVVWNRQDSDLDPEPSGSDTAETTPEDSTDSEVSPAEPCDSTPSPGPRRSGRIRRLPERLRTGDYHLYQQHLSKSEEIDILKELVSFLNTSQRVLEILLQKTNLFCK